MLRLLYGLIFGTSKISFPAEDVPTVYRLLSEARISTEPIKLGHDDTASVIVPDRAAGLLMRLGEHAGVEMTKTQMPGLPHLVARYRHRPGIFIGTALFFLIIYFSGKIIWNFDVTGNVSVSDQSVVECLEKLGCSAGAYIPDIDFDKLQNDVLLENNTLAWLSVNMDGNLARVEVKERRVVPSEYVPSNGLSANIVAAEDGVIERCLVKNGKASVENGDVVRRGELLISGVIDVKEREVRYERADGEVLARVVRTIEANVPYDFVKKCDTGRKTSDLSVKIFGKTINIRSRGSIAYNIYGKITEENQVILSGGVKLPMFILRTTYSEEREEREALDAERATAEAREQASAKLREMAADAQILSLDETVTENEDGVTVTLRVYAVANIAANYGFSADGGNTEYSEDKTADEENGNDR